jgi:hypothetical protein
VIIVASSFAILYLIREDRLQSIFRFTHRRHQRSASSSTPFIYSATSDRPSRLWSWRTSFFKFFHPRSDTNDTSALGRPSTVQDGHHWYQTGSGDTWDYTVPQLMEVPNTPLQSYPYCTSPPPLPETPLPNPYALIYNHDSSASSMHLDLSDPRKASPTYTQSNQTFSSNLDLHRVVSSPLNSSSPMPASSSSLRSGSPIPRQAVSPVPPEPTVPPGISQRTFEGGSKFLEAL